MSLKKQGQPLHHSLPSGRKKRARTRDQLVETGIAMLADNSFANASILQVATAAGVSNGTFYNYFQSKNELMEAVAFDLSEQIAHQLRRQFKGVEDPAQRIVIAARTFMQRAMEEPDFGWALMRLLGSSPKMSDTIRLSIQMDVREGKAKGRFQFCSEAAAIDLVLGTLLAGIRSLLEQHESEQHIRAIGEISLVGLGMSIQQAKNVVHSLLD